MKKILVLITLFGFIGLFTAPSYSQSKMGDEAILFDDQDTAIFNDIPLDSLDNQNGLGTSTYLATTSEKVALLYHKMIGKEPSFSHWATFTKDYKKAPDFHKSIVVDEKVSEWQSEFDLMSGREEIIIETVISISKYNERFKGYLFRGLNEETFFNYSFAGTNVVVIPKQIEDHQWFTVGTEQSQQIEAALNNKRQAYVRVILSPKYADKKSTLPIGKKDYWLLLGTVAKMELLSLQGKHSLWASDQDFLAEKKQKELLDDYRPEF